MTPEQSAIVVKTWERITPIAGQASELFYDQLFEIDPSLREMFKGVDMAGQRQKLVGALDTVIGSLDRPDEIVPDLEALGRRHRGYGVTDEHYDTVGSALLSTLEKGLADAWTAEVEEAWTAAYALVSGSMQNGAAAGDSAGPGWRSAGSSSPEQGLPEPGLAMPAK